MSDLIDRQDAIDELMEVPSYGLMDDDGNIESGCKYSDVLAMLNNLPSTQRWIPCSEWLPKKLEDVVICFADAPEESDVAYMRKTFNETYKSQGCENEFVSHMGETTYADYEVLAWMPLPDPWKGDKDVRKSN